LLASEKSLRNGPFDVDYLGHAQQLIAEECIRGFVPKSHPGALALGKQLDDLKKAFQETFSISWNELADSFGKRRATVDKLNELLGPRALQFTEFFLSILTTELTLREAVYEALHDGLTASAVDCVLSAEADPSHLVEACHKVFKGYACMSVWCMVLVRNHEGLRSIVNDQWLCTHEHIMRMMCACANMVAPPSPDWKGSVLALPNDEVGSAIASLQLFRSTLLSHGHDLFRMLGREFCNTNNTSATAKNRGSRRSKLS
jgi:hypothetical protein